MKKPSEDLRQSNNVWLTIEDFEYLCFDFTREYMSYDEPIPDYSTRDISLLESSLGSQKQTFGGELLYPTLFEQASILFYSLIKNHPFKNGNKRIAVISLLAFLSLNKKWLSIAPYSLYTLARYVAGTDPKKKEVVLDEIKAQIKKYMISYPAFNQKEQK